MAIVVPPPETNANPACPHCGKPGQLNRNGGPGPGTWYYCTNKDCSAPVKPHNWFVIR